MKFTRRLRRKRVTNELQSDSYLSNELLIQTQVTILEIIDKLNNDIELFYFHGKGIISVSDYLSCQMNRIEVVRKELLDIHNTIYTKINEKIEMFINSIDLQNEITNIKAHHPFKDCNAANDFAADNWSKLRSINRLSDQFQIIIKRLFVLAQLKFDNSVALLIEKFWLRYRRFLEGIDHFSSNQSNQQKYFWDLENIELNDNVHIHSNYDSVDESLNSKADNVISGSMLNDNVYTFVNNAALQTQNIGGTNPYANKMKIKIDGLSVDEEWEQRGSHLCINIALSLNKSIISNEDMHSINKIDNLKAITVPSRSQILSQMNNLCGFIGYLIESLPCNFFDPSVYSSHIGKSNEIDVYNLDSSKYYSVILSRPIYNCTRGYDLAVASIQDTLRAYSEAFQVDSYLFKLFEIMRKLSALAPGSLTKQIERSLIVVKLKDNADGSFFLDDLSRSTSREVSRLTSIKAIVHYLESSKKLLGEFQNIKFKSGLVTSFRSIINQISNYLVIQEKRFFSKLPTSFIMRCQAFYEYLNYFENLVSNSSIKLDDLGI